MYGVLFVDDEIFALSFLKSKLNDVDFKSYFASSGEQALSILESENNIQILVTDLNMDKMDGFELLKRVRELYPHIFRVVLSAHKGPFMIKQAIEDGDIHEFLPKPADIKTHLIPILDSLLRSIDKKEV